MRLHVADNSWCAECQWRSGKMRDFGLSAAYRLRRGQRLLSQARGHLQSGNLVDSLEHLPMGALENTETGSTLCWQIEHNGSWYWEISDLAHELVLRVSGPTYRDGLWSKRLAPGGKFASVPVTFARVRGDLEAALGTLTRRKETAAATSPRIWRHSR